MVMQPNINQGFNRQQTPQQQQGGVPPVGIPVEGGTNNQRPTPNQQAAQQTPWGNAVQNNSGPQQPSTQPGQGQGQGPSGDWTQNLWKTFGYWSNVNMYQQQPQQSQPRTARGKNKRPVRQQHGPQTFNSWDDLNQIFSTFKPRQEGGF